MVNSTNNIPTCAQDIESVIAKVVNNKSYAISSTNNIVLTGTKSLPVSTKAKEQIGLKHSNRGLQITNISADKFATVRAMCAIGKQLEHSDSELKNLMNSKEQYNEQGSSSNSVLVDRLFNTFFAYNCLEQVQYENEKFSSKLQKQVPVTHTEYAAMLYTSAKLSSHEIYEHSNRVTKQYPLSSGTTRSSGIYSSDVNRVVTVAENCLSSTSLNNNSVSRLEHSIVLIDTPDLRKSLKSKMNGLSMADAAIVTVSIGDFWPLVDFRQRR